MDEYKMMYLTLFNAVTDALAELESTNYGKTKDILITAQQRAAPEPTSSPASGRISQ